MSTKSTNGTCGTIWRGRAVRFKIVAGVLVLALIISLGLNIYFYLQVIDRQSVINNIRSEIIVEWANEMDVAAHYLKNATTNIDVAEEYGVRWFLLSAYHIVKITYDQGDDWVFYEPFVHAPLDAAGNLIPYEEGALVAPIVERRISSGAIEMFANLADKIWNVTGLIFKEAQDFIKNDGVDPSLRLEEKGVLDEILDACLDISFYSYQIHEFNPKFQ